MLINGITVQEIARRDGLREDIDLVHGPSVRKGYFVPNWSDRFTVARGLLGLTASTTLNGLVTLYYPAQYPEIAGIYCHHLSIEPVGRPTQGAKQIQWPSCIVWASYGRLPFLANSLNQIDPTNPQLFATQRLSFSASQIEVPATNLKFQASGNQLVDQHYAIRMPTMEYELVFKQVPWLPSWDTFSGVIGTLNNATFLKVPAGQMMFNGVESNQACNYDGTYSQELAFSFSIRSQPWDYSWDSAAGAWGKVVTSSGGAMIQRTDFTQILPQYQVLGG